MSQSRAYINDILAYFLQPEDGTEGIAEECVNSFDDAPILKYFDDDMPAKYLAAAQRQIKYQKGQVSAEDEEITEAAWV
jgi:hypothetical protein